MSYFVYILKNLHNDLYVGQTNNITKRTKEHLHKTQKAAKFTKDHSTFELVYKEEFLTRAEAMKREKQLKGWSHAKKDALITGDLMTLKKLSKSSLMVKNSM
jgi:predicted GIY-YIG superfamily endonuclease